MQFGPGNELLHFDSRAANQHRMIGTNDVGAYEIVEIVLVLKNACCIFLLESRPKKPNQ